MSVLYEAELNVKENVSEKIQRIRGKYVKGDYKCRAAVDAGYNSWLVAVTTVIGSKKEINTKIKSKAYPQKPTSEK